MVTFFPVAILFVLLAIAVPVGFTMGLAGIAGLVGVGGWGMLEGILKTAPLSAVNSYEFLTIPMFLLMAEFILMSRIADDLFKTAAAWIGQVRGGLGIATALAGAAFGAICGTSTASAATLSATTLPAMIKQGYEPSMAAGAVAISGTLAILIPPSVAMVIYGLIADVNIGQLLIAGLIPAAIVTATIVFTIWFLAWKDPSVAPLAPAASWTERLRLLRTTGPVLLLFGFVTGTIYSGIATPTEASALGAFGALAVAIARGTLTVDGVYTALVRATHGTCMILMILLGASLFGYYFTVTQFTQDLVMWVGALETSRWVILFFILVGYIILGSFMDQTAILILTVPIVLPVIRELGFDPIWFGVIKIVTAEVGLITPPVGLNCFVVARYANLPPAVVFRGSMPHFFAHLVALAILVAFPDLSLWLPRQMQ